MIRSQLASLFQTAVDALRPADVSLPLVEIQEPRDPSHGDFACNFALMASKALGQPPRQIAEALVAALPANAWIASTEIAGPGFINIRLKPEAVANQARAVLSLGVDGLARAGAAEAGAAPQRINLEFVSVNPNGPITVGSGRGAAFGSTLANVLEAAGRSVHREYYINDGVNSEQMRLFTESVRALAYGQPVPENGYKGDYVAEVAQEFTPLQLGDDFSVFDEIAVSALRSCHGKYPFSLPSEAISGPDGKRYGNLTGPGFSTGYLIDEILQHPLTDEEFADAFRQKVEQTFRDLSPGFRAEVEVQEVQGKNQTYAELQIKNIRDLSLLWWQKRAEAIMLGRQRIDLGLFGVAFDTWFSEQSLHDTGAVERDVADLEAKGAADREPIRHKLKLGKGGVIEDVEIEPQTGQVNEEGEADAESLPQAQKDGATLWLRSTKFGDDMDRVLRRADGRLTYIASDVAYHKDKFNRGSKPDASGHIERADKLITVLGPDHHGYIGRLHAVVGALLESNEPQASAANQGGAGAPPLNSTKSHLGEGLGRGEVRPELTEIEAKLYRSPAERDACLAALAESKEKLEVVIFQIVRFVKDGKPAPMRKRDGNIYSLRDLMSEIGKTAAPNEPEDVQMQIGKDVARFFYLMRSHDTHMDFDIDLATKQSDENPVFYCQYAYARICSVLEKAKEAGFDADEGAVKALAHERELDLIKKICDLPFEVRRCAEDYGVHRLTTYAQELARAYHHFYDACRILQPDQPELTRARLALCRACQVGLAAVFQLLGVTPRERMDRAEPDPSL